jgi:hypothetical protein
MTTQTQMTMTEIIETLQIMQDNIHCDIRNEGGDAANNWIRQSSMLGQAIGLLNSIGQNPNWNQ